MEMGEGRGGEGKERSLSLPKVNFPVTSLALFGLLTYFIIASKVVSDVSVIP